MFYKLAAILDRPFYEVNRSWSVTRTHFNLPLRASFDKLRTNGNLDEVVHTSADRCRYDDGIATLRSQ